MLFRLVWDFIPRATVLEGIVEWGTLTVPIDHLVNTMQPEYIYPCDPLHTIQ